MVYFKNIVDNYIVSVGTGKSGTIITESEYNTILDTIRSKPKAPEGFDYRLKADLTWELYELPPVPTDDEITAEEALDIITGGAV